MYAPGRKPFCSDEKFEQCLRDQAADTEQIAARRGPHVQ
jgi:hypothetical protein